MEPTGKALLIQTWGEGNECRVYGGRAYHLRSCLLGWRSKCFRPRKKHLQWVFSRSANVHDYSKLVKNQSINFEGRVINMSAFEPRDVWGIVGGMLLLIFIYLILQDEGTPFSSIITASSTAAGGLIRNLQGRY